MTAYFWCKTLHLVGVVSWMAGLFYVGRLFVNHVEALDRPEPARAVLHEQLAGMTRRCYLGILTPAFAITAGTAAGMLALQPALVGEGWVQAKLALVALLFGYHLLCGRWMRRLARGERPYGSHGFRVLNEVPTVFLLAIVVLAVFKQAATVTTLAQGLGGLVAFIALGMWGYARRRARAARAAGATSPADPAATAGGTFAAAR